MQMSNHFWKSTTLFAFVIYLAFTFSFILLGKVNADEGWYLYASKLVYEGRLPYQDFAYTQTPLLPYVYGIAQEIFSPSIYLGRIVTSLFSFAALIISVSIARKYSGEKSGAITALLWATFTYGIYYQSITKTYALTTLFFVLALFLIVSESNQQWRLVASTTFVLLATLTRLSALFFAVPITAYAFIRANKRTKFVIIALCLIAFSWVMLLAYPNVESAKWNLLTHHTDQWNNLSYGEQIAEIVSYRLPTLFVVFPSYFLLLFTIVLLGLKQIRSCIQRIPGSLAGITAFLFFIFPHLATGGFHTEYFVPFLFGLFPLIGIIYVEVYQQQNRYSKLMLQVFLLSTLVLGLLRGGLFYWDISDGRLPVEEIKEVAIFVSNNTSPEDKIYALEALWVVLEANRQTMPNMTMAQFSFFTGNTNAANQLNLVNDQITLDYITNTIPKLVVLTDADWMILRRTASFNQIVFALEENYELLLEKETFGQGEAGVKVYIRKEGN